MDLTTTIVLVFLYLAIGFAGACIYNEFTGVPLPSDMTEEEKNVMFGITLFWPIAFIIFLIKRTIAFIKWLIGKIKDKKMVK